MQLIAARQDNLSYDRLQRFISVRGWDESPLARAFLAEALAEADRIVGWRDAVQVVDGPSLIETRQ